MGKPKNNASEQALNSAISLIKSYNKESKIKTTRDERNKINDEFTLRRNGLEYTFYADEMVPVTKSKGFLKALDLLEIHYQKNPSLYQLAKSILIHKVYLFLPLTYEEYEADSLEKEVIEEVEEALNAMEEQ